ncbi:MAG TPA: protein kinase [Pyrinomonadaceae bacterium]|nr:protein kinase [Pyrinomonadaceae bacterium]
MIGREILNYRILEKLGEGGHGVVYKALDLNLGREVVVKCLSPALTSNRATLARFDREARLASSLDHPNICTIFGFHEVEGTHFIVMQYVRGRNVRQLVSGKALEMRGALSVASQVADALASAHERKIIHRDIKAGNVMVTETGQVKVLDFGLAKLTDEKAARAGGIHLTEQAEAGVPHGTATYAAPEQARGHRTDHRADIFSTGVLLYEMLAGTWPFRGTTNVEVRYAVIHDTPKPLSEVRPDAPPLLQQILDRALAKDPEARYQSAAELCEDLRGALRETATDQTAGGLSAVVAPVAPRHLSGGGAGLAGTLRRWLRGISGAEPSKDTTPSAQRSSPPAPAHASQPPSREAPRAPELTAKSTLAILPFRNLGEDAGTDFYGFALADAAITELARLRRLVVRPSSVVAKYQAQAHRDPRDIGRELQVGSVLAASYLATDGRLRVNAQLLDVAGGQILWSDRIDAVVSDLITVQDTIAQRIVDGLRVELSDDEQVALERRSSVNPEAYDEYLRGRDRLARYAYHTPSREDFERAVEHFRRAVALDPSYAPAHSGLGVCHTTRIFDKLGGEEDYERAEEALYRALNLDPGLAEARLHMVFIYLARGEKQKARAEVVRLLHEAPNDAAVHRVAANLFRLDGEHDRALEHFDRAAALNPDERVNSHYSRARVYNSRGRADLALGELERASEIEPDHPLIKTVRAFMFYYRGEVGAATGLVREVLASHPEMDGVRPLLAMCLSRQGEHRAARAELNERVKASAAVDPDIAYWLASAFALEGMKDEAFGWLGRAIALGREDRAWFEADPDWAALRDDPRFSELMDRIAAGRDSAEG